MKYQCKVCNLQGFKEKVCPECGNPNPDKMCKEDHRCTCKEDIHDGIAYCPECGAAICPGCGSHDVSQVSRVTGYLSDISGWNEGKQQEVRDRMRYTVT